MGASTTGSCSCWQVQIAYYVIHMWELTWRKHGNAETGWRALSEINKYTYDDNLLLSRAFTFFNLHQYCLTNFKKTVSLYIIYLTS